VSEPRYIRPYKLVVGAFVPNWLMERTEVSAGAKLCYARIAQHEGADGEAKARQEVLAAELGVGERMVRNYVHELERHRLIEVVQVGLNQANRYRFLFHSWMGIDAEGISGPDRNDTSGPEWNDLSGPERQDASGPTNEENQRRETGAGAPERPAETPTLFRAEGLPQGSPGSLGSPPPPSGGAPPPPGTSQNGHNGGSPKTTEIVRQVFEAWREATGHPNAKLTDARRKKVTARHREGYTVEQMCLVVAEAWRYDPWPGRVDNNDLVILLRDGPQVEKFLNLARTVQGNGQPAGNGASPHLDPEEELRVARERDEQARRRLLDANSTGLAERLAQQPHPQGAAS
jgi:hypothetical protein